MKPEGSTIVPVRPRSRPIHVKLRNPSVSSVTNVTTTTSIVDGSKIDVEIITEDYFIYWMNTSFMKSEGSTNIPIIVTSRIPDIQLRNPSVGTVPDVTTT